jgi:hypothetical protein
MKCLERHLATVAAWTVCVCVAFVYLQFRTVDGGNKRQGRFQTRF